MIDNVMQKPTLDMKNFISKKRFFVIFKYATQNFNKRMKFRAPKLTFRRRVHRF